MTDVHSHILFNVDDGSKSIEESISLLKKMKDIGFNNVILTPHYINGSEYCSKNKEKLEKLNELRDELKNQVFEMFDARAYKFTTLACYKRFQKQLKLLKKK